MHGLIEPELFYMPWGKKIKYIYLNFQELQYLNYDKMLEDYPEYTDDILKRDKYGSLMTEIRSQTEFMFLDSNHNPIFKACPNGSVEGAIRIDNIPYGKYYVKIIKSKGYLLDEFEIVVDSGSNEKVYDIILTRSIMKVEMGIDQTESNNDYKFLAPNPSRYYDISCQSSGRLYYKFYDPNGKYLGKKIVGCASFGYDPDLITPNACRFWLTYYPINLKAQFTKITHYTSSGAISTTQENKFEGSNLQEPASNSRANFGYANILNLPSFYKKFMTGVYSNDNIQLTNIWSNGSVYQYTNFVSIPTYYYEKREDIFVEHSNHDTGTTIKESIGYNFYYEDGMTEDIDSAINDGYKNNSSFRYLGIFDDYQPPILAGCSQYYPYYENLYSDDYTLYCPCTYLLMSDDYDDYRNFQRVWQFDFNTENKKDGENE